MTNPSLDAELQRPLSARAQEQKSQQRRRPRRTPLSPAQMVIVMALAIFTCECAVMFLLYILPPISPIMEAIVDSSALVLSLVPFYFFFYRPFWNEHRQTLKETSILSRKLMTSVEAERKRVSHDLHDQCGQTLTALQFRAGALRRSLPKEHEDLQEQVHEMDQLISQLSDELRDVTCQLRPETFEKLGLVLALRDLVDDFRAIHPAVQFDESYDYRAQDGSDQNEKLELALYRICQECLHNIAKHAQASQVNVRLIDHDGQIMLLVADDGTGFITRGSRRKKMQSRQGIGLLGIRERVDELGGDLDLIAAPGGGTTVKVVIPLANEGIDGTTSH